MTDCFQKPRIILVTGMPRSGTTAVGKVLSFHRNVGELYEPLNFHVGSKVIHHYYEFLGLDGFDKNTLDGLVSQIKALKVCYKKSGFPEDRRGKLLFKRLFGGRPAMTQWACRLTPFLETIIWKDPFASFLAEYLYENHKMPCIATIRHPLAVAGSFKRMRWSFDLDRIKKGCEKYGINVKPIAKLPVNGKANFSINSAVLWFLVNSALLEYQERTNGVSLVNLEDVVSNPIGTYKSLYNLTRLPWSERIARRIRRHYMHKYKAPEPRGGVAHDQKRDLSQVNRYYQQYLSEDEIEEIMSICGPVWDECQKRFVG